MVQIVQGSNVGGRLGKASQSSLDSLEKLVNLKLGDIQQQQARQRQIPGLQALFPNYNPQQLESLAAQDPGLLRELYKNQARQPGEEAYAQSLASILGGSAPNQLAQGLSNPRLNAEQATKLAQIALQKQQNEEARKIREAQFAESSKLKREQFETARSQKQEQQQATAQTKVDLSNKPYLTMLQKGEDLGRNIVSIADQMQALLDTGKVFSGVKGKFTPRIAQNTETQQFESLSNDLASLVASNSGVATNFKIKFAQERKPNLAQKPPTQKALVQKIRQEGQNVLDRAEARDRLIEGNEGKQPENIQSLINKTVKLQQKPQQLKQIPLNLPDASNLPDGKVAKNKTSGKVEFVVEGGQWRPA